MASPDSRLGAVDWHVARSCPVRDPCSYRMPRWRHRAYVRRADRIAPHLSPSSRPRPSASGATGRGSEDDLRARESRFELAVTPLRRGVTQSGFFVGSAQPVHQMAIAGMIVDRLEQRVRGEPWITRKSIRYAVCNHRTASSADRAARTRCLDCRRHDGPYRDRRQSCRSSPWHAPRLLRCKHTRQGCLRSDIHRFASLDTCQHVGGSLPFAEIEQRLAEVHPNHRRVRLAYQALGTATSRSKPAAEQLRGDHEPLGLDIRGRVELQRGFRRRVAASNNPRW